jgi:hypothetical protein
MSIRTVVVSLCLLAALGTAAPARAQFTSTGPATGETYRIEISGSLWDPTPEIFLSSESLEGIAGSRIDFVEDLGIEKKWFRQLKIVARPTEKAKFRFEYTPIKYESSAVVQRNLVFNGILFPASVPVDTEVLWRAFRFGYEYDFFYRDRGFVGVVIEAKYTHVEATLRNQLDEEFVRARAPIPAIGVIGRGYVVPNVAITGEFTFFKIPDIDEDYGGNYYDLDIYGTVNFTPNFGAQLGYRSFDVSYLADRDAGDLKLKGIYFGGVVRF